MTGLVRRLRRRLGSGDAGTSLMEMVVGMAVLTVFMGIFTGAVVGMTQTINKVEAVTTSSSQTNIAFLTLDKLVRYSTAIATPLTGAGGDWYVELDTVDGITSAETCTQLRVDVPLRQLQQRTWTATGLTTYTNLAGWKMIANNITNGAAATGDVDQPFSTPPPLGGASTGYQRLQITLVAGTDGPSSPTTSRARTTFTALNSVTSATTNAAKCQQVGHP